MNVTATQLKLIGIVCGMALAVWLYSNLEDHPNGAAVATNPSRSGLDELRVPSRNFWKEGEKEVQKQRELGLGPALPRESQPQYPISITIDYKVERSGLVILGATNLPEGTKLGVEVRGQSSRAQDFDVFVRNGRFRAGPFTNQGRAILGTREVAIMLHRNRFWQTPNILQELNQILDSRFERGRLEVSKSISIGSNGQIQTEANRNLRQGEEFARLYSSAQRLLESAQELGKLRNDRSISQCMTQMEALLPRVDQLRQQIERLPATSEKVLLGTASVHLRMCATCLQSLASENCREATTYLRQIRIGQ